MMEHTTTYVLSGVHVILWRGLSLCANPAGAGGSEVCIIDSLHPSEIDSDGVIYHSVTDSSRDR